jgi:hypothetical protein
VAVGRTVGRAGGGERASGKRSRSTDREPDGKFEAQSLVGRER